MKYLFLIILLSGCLDNRPKEVRDIESKMKVLDDDTLLGPDKNNDGVRDDVEYWIKNSKKIENNDIRRAILLYAKYLRDGLRLHKDKQKSIANTYKGQVYGDCYSLLFEPFSKERRKIRKYILSIMFNTKERVRANLVADRNFAGEGGRSIMFADEACPFKLEGKYQKRGERYVPKK